MVLDNDPRSSTSNMESECKANDNDNKKMESLGDLR
jgi:hypothetical protein